MNFAFLLILTTPILCMGQGSGSVATPPDVSGSDAVPFLVTKSFTGVILQIDGGKIVLEDAKRKIELKLVADKVRVLGKDNPTPASLKAGQKVRAAYTPSDMTLRNIRILTGAAQ